MEEKYFFLYRNWYNSSEENKNADSPFYFRIYKQTSLFDYKVAYFYVQKEQQSFVDIYNSHGYLKINPSHIKKALKHLESEFYMEFTHCISTF